MPATAEMIYTPDADVEAIKKDNFDARTAMDLLEEVGLSDLDNVFFANDIGGISDLVTSGSAEDLQLAMRMHERLNDDINWAKNRGADSINEAQAEAVHDLLVAAIGDEGMTKLGVSAEADDSEDEHKITKDRPFPDHKKKATNVARGQQGNPAKPVTKPVAAKASKPVRPSATRKKLKNGQPVQNGVEVTPPALKTPEELSRDQVLADQAERRQTGWQDMVDDYIAKGEPDPVMDQFINGMERMEQNELERGGIFEKYVNFVNIEPFLKHKRMEGVNAGIGSGFEQGQKVTVEQTSGDIEDDWMFAGVAKNGRVRLVKQEEETGDILFKDVNFQDFERLNQAPADDSEADPDSVASKQAARRALHQKTIDDYVAAGNSDTDMDAFLNGMARREALEQQLGKTFDSYTDFLAYEVANKTAPANKSVEASYDGKEKISITDRVRRRWIAIQAASKSSDKLKNTFNATFGNEKGEKARRNALIAALAGATAVGLYVYFSQKGVDATGVLGDNLPKPGGGNGARVAEAAGTPSAGIEAHANPSSLGLDLGKDMPWTVANKLSAGNETSAIQSAMNQYATASGVEVGFTGTGANTMIKVGNHIANPADLKAINEIIFNQLG